MIGYDRNPTQLSDDEKVIMPGRQLMGARAVIFDRELGVLTVRRSPQVNLGGLLCLPGGHGNVGELPRDTLYRELLEELGKRVRIICLIAARRLFALGRVADMFHFEAEFVDEGQIFIDKAEVSEIVWITLDNINNYQDFMPGDREIIEQFLQAKQSA